MISCDFCEAEHHTWHCDKVAMNRKEEDHEVVFEDYKREIELNPREYFVTIKNLENGKQYTGPKPNINVTFQVVGDSWHELERCETFYTDKYGVGFANLGLMKQWKNGKLYKVTDDRTLIYYSSGELRMEGNSRLTLEYYKSGNLKVKRDGDLFTIYEDTKQANQLFKFSMSHDKILDIYQEKTSIIE